MDFIILTEPGIYKFQAQADEENAGGGRTAMKNASRRGLLSSALALPFITRAAAQPTWPDRPVRIVVPWPAAGAIDILARAMAERLGQRWGQPVLVENRVGAASIIGADVVAKAPADGYTLMLAANAITAANKRVRDLIPHSLPGSLPTVFALRPRTPSAAAGTRRGRNR